MHSAILELVDADLSLHAQSASSVVLAQASSMEHMCMALLQEAASREEEGGAAALALASALASQASLSCLSITVLRIIVVPCNATTEVPILPGTCVVQSTLIGGCSSGLIVLSALCMDCYVRGA